MSVATSVFRSKGGQFVAHVQALPGNPYDGHSLAKVIPAIEKQLGNSPSRFIADAGYRGHKAPLAYRLKVYTQVQKRNVTAQIKRELKRRSAVEPVIGHLKSGHRMERNYRPLHRRRHQCRPRRSWLQLPPPAQMARASLRTDPETDHLPPPAGNSAQTRLTRVLHGRRKQRSPEEPWFAGCVV